MEKVNNDDVYETCDNIDDYLYEEPEQEEKKKLTSEQLREIEFLRKLNRTFNNSVELLNNKTPLNSMSLLTENAHDFDSVEELLDRVIDLTIEQKQITEELGNIRPLLKEVLLKRLPLNQQKIFYRGFVASISQGKRSSSKKFDEEKFKSENPELYAKYCYTTYSGGFGGNLSLRSITEKQSKALRRLNTKAKEKLRWEK